MFGFSLRRFSWTIVFATPILNLPRRYGLRSRVSSSRKPASNTGRRSVRSLRRFVYEFIRFGVKRVVLSLRFRDGRPADRDASVLRAGRLPRTLRFLFLAALLVQALLIAFRFESLQEAKRRRAGGRDLRELFLPPLRRGPAMLAVNEPARRSAGHAAFVGKPRHHVASASGVGSRNSASGPAKERHSAR